MTCLASLLAMRHPRVPALPGQHWPSPSDRCLPCLQEQEDEDEGAGDQVCAGSCSHAMQRSPPPPPPTLLCADPRMTFLLLFCLVPRLTIIKCFRLAAVPACMGQTPELLQWRARSTMGMACQYGPYHPTRPQSHYLPPCRLALAPQATAETMRTMT